MINELLDDAENRMKGAISSLKSDFAAMRTGRANPSLLDKIVVEAYGMEMPMNQVGLVSVPESHQLAIRPFDVTTIPAIEKAILKSDLGLMPNNDGKIIRLNLPRLNEERRRDLSKLVGKRVEDAKVGIRNVRRDALNDMREYKDEKMIQEDELFSGQEKLQKLTDKFVNQTDELGKEKEEEIMEI